MRGTGTCCTSSSARRSSTSDSSTRCSLAATIFSAVAWTAPARAMGCWARGGLVDVPSVPVAVALGSNLGDRRAHLEFAIARLADVLDGVRVSSMRETEALDVPDSQPRYLNAVVTGQTALEPA